MCLAIPGVIEEINADGPLKMARVNFRGVHKEACIEWVPEAKIGDYVVVHAGFALNIVNAEEAKETIRMLEEVAQSPDAYIKW